MLALLLSLLFAFASGAQPAALERVIDADTYILRIELGYDVIARVTVRVAGIDTPERFTPEGRVASKDAEAILRATRITVLATGARTFARHVGHVFVDGVSIAQWLRVHEKQP